MTYLGRTIGANSLCVCGNLNASSKSSGQVGGEVLNTEPEHYAKSGATWSTREIQYHECTVSLCAMVHGCPPTS